MAEPRKPLTGSSRAEAELRPARGDDLAPILRLLGGEGLPAAGVEEFLATFVVAESDGDLVGVAGLEIHGRDGVLRSVAVAPAARGEGLGARLTRRVVDDARSAGLRNLYLLTTTADAWFPRHGFRVIPRDQASPQVQGSVEFREACPASATAMVLELDENRT